MPPYLVTEICFALQAAYPAGDGSVAILRSMPPNNRRVRWVSASSNQYERVAMSMDSIPLVRLIFGVLVAIGLYLTYVGWLAKPASSLAKNNP